MQTARIQHSDIVLTCDGYTRDHQRAPLGTAGHEPGMTPALRKQHHPPVGVSHRHQLFSSAAAAVVPLRASRVALPESLRLIPLTTVLPPAVAATYATSEAASLMRDADEVRLLDTTQPLKPPRIAGSRTEYVLLIGRLAAAGMVRFTARPRAVNGVFTVVKDTDSDRLIIDAQPANRLFADSPAVDLPNASHLVQLRVPKGAILQCAKSDLSNFYHHLALPEWMQPFFALPPLTAAELRQLGIATDGHALYPMCVSLPMGFSHAVYLAQTAHEHVLYSHDAALLPSDSVLCSPSLSLAGARCLHGIYIDDLFIFSLDRHAAEAQLDRVVAAYQRAGFVVKQSKLVRPTSSAVRVLGFTVDGAAASICPAPDTVHSLLSDTRSLLGQTTVTGTALGRLVGSWTWIMLLRRPTLAVLQHAYRYAELAKHRPFTLWPGVRRELCAVVSLLPLMHAQLDAPTFHRLIASDASELGAGATVTPLTAAVDDTVRPLCSSRAHAYSQALLRGEPLQRLLATPECSRAPQWCHLPALAAQYAAYYSTVTAAPWTTIISRRWIYPEHINALELRAVVLVLHWLVTHTTSLGRRALMLLDSQVAHYALTKGRSSAPALLPILRKASALQLAGGVTLSTAWLPSELNPADEPSRCC